MILKKQLMIKKLKQTSSLFDYNHHAHELEHSIEIQIPLIQKYCGFEKYRCLDDTLQQKS